MGLASLVVLAPTWVLNHVPSICNGVQFHHCISIIYPEIAAVYRGQVYLSVSVQHGSAYRHLSATACHRAWQVVPAERGKLTGLPIVSSPSRTPYVFVNPTKGNIRCILADRDFSCPVAFCIPSPSSVMVTLSRLNNIIHIPWSEYRRRIRIVDGLY